MPQAENIFSSFKSKLASYTPPPVPEIKSPLESIDHENEKSETPVPKEEGEFLPLDGLYPEEPDIAEYMDNQAPSYEEEWQVVVKDYLMAKFPSEGEMIFQEYQAITDRYSQEIDLAYNELSPSSYEEAVEDKLDAHLKSLHNAEQQELQELMGEAYFELREINAQLSDEEEIYNQAATSYNGFGRAFAPFKSFQPNFQAE